MVRTQIQLTEDQAQALKELSLVEKRSVAELVRRSVDAYLRSSAPVGREELKRRALAAIGRFSSDVSDLSSRHDHYLAEAFGD